MNREPICHNYLNQVWGHTAKMSRSTDDCKTGTMIGFGYDIQEGDFLMLLSRRGGSCPYRVDSIFYSSRVADSWTAEVTLTLGVFEVLARTMEIIRTPKDIATRDRFWAEEVRRER